MGGGPKHLYDLCSSLDEFEVYIASPLSEPFGKAFQKLSTEHFEIPHRKLSIKKLLQLLIFCKQRGIYLIHSHGRGAGLYSRALALFGIKVIHTFHGVHAPKSFKEKSLLVFEKALSFLTKKFISVSENEAQNALNLELAKNHQIIVINNGINPEDYIKSTIGPDKKVIGTISRLDPHKNNSELIKFVGQLKDYQLLIAGDGEEYQSLNQNLPSNVKLLGEVKDIAHFLTTIDIYASSSKGEGLPYSVLEAIASKKKIILSDVSGHQDLVNKEGLYQLSDFRDFKNKLFTAKSYELKEEFYLKTMVKKTKDLLGELLS